MPDLDQLHDSASNLSRQEHEGDIKAKRVLVFGSDGSNRYEIPLTAGGVKVATDASLSGSVSITGTVTVDGSGVTQPVSAVSLPLPADAATQTTLAALLAELAAKADLAETQPVSAASLPLPSGAATESTLSTLDGKVTACNTGAVVLAAGSAAIGKLVANSGVDIGDVDVASTVLPTPKTILTAAISASSSGDNTVVAADVSNRIKVIGYIIQATGTVNVAWKRASTAISGTHEFKAREGISERAEPPHFVFATDANEALILNLSAAIGVVGRVTYYLEA